MSGCSHTGLGFPASLAGTPIASNAGGTGLGNEAGVRQKRPRQIDHFGVGTKGDMPVSPIAIVLLVPSVMSRMRVFELMPNTPRSLAGTLASFQQSTSLTP
jgi:hypothetical protein